MPDEPPQSPTAQTLFPADSMVPPDVLPAALIDPSLSVGEWTALALVLGGGVLFLASLSALLNRSGPIRLRHFVEEAGGRLRGLLDRPAHFEAYRFLVSVLARTSLAAFAICLVELLVSAGLGLVASGLGALGAVVVLGFLQELANRLLVGRDPERALRRLTVAYRVLLLFVFPFIYLTAPLLSRSPDEREIDPSDTGEASEEEIEAYIAVGTAEGILEPDEEDLVRSVVDFGDTQVRSVMTPRIDIVSAPMSATLSELAHLFVDSRHARIPLYTESIDEVVGIVHIRDLLRALNTRPRPVPAELMRPAYFVPVTKLLDELLRELQERHQAMAIVVDEYGGTSGLVTLEDLVEEIVGDISDEDEVRQEEILPLPDGSFRLEGRTHLEDLDDLWETDLASGPYETVSGLLLGLIGEVPEIGTRIEHEDLTFIIEKVSDRRVETLRIEKTEQAEDEASYG